MIVTGQEFADAAIARKYDGVSYQEMDCQSFVEHVLADVGIKHDWLGSNDMWRNMVEDQKEKDECMKENNGIVPPGYICFTIKHDGKEPDRYKDGINAAHVGIVLEGGRVRHSTTGGVQYDTIDNKRWTHVAKHKLITYDTDETDSTPTIDKIYDLLLQMYELLERTEQK